MSSIFSNNLGGIAFIFANTIPLLSSDTRSFLAVGNLKRMTYNEFVSLEESEAHYLSNP